LQFVGMMASMLTIFPDQILRPLPKLRTAWFAGIAVFVFSLMVVEKMVEGEFEKIQTRSNLDAVAYGSALRTRVDRELNKLLYISVGLESYLNVYHTQLERDKVTLLLSDLYKRGRHLRNVAIAIGYTVTYVFPVQGNEKVMGLNYPNIPSQWPQVKQAVDTAKGVLVGPLDLVQGGSGLIYRYPVFIDNAYWGMISVVIDTPSFMEAAFQGTEGKGYEFAVRNRTTDGTFGTAFYGDPAMFNRPGTVLMNSEVPDGTWQWAIKSQSPPAVNLVWTIRLMGWLLSLAFALAVYAFFRERSQLANLALFDELTGLANRRLITDRLEQTIRRLGREQDQHCAVFFFDLDRFKEINDKHGHAAGDQVLMSVAQGVSEELRLSDTVGRLGGDEFVVISAYTRNPQHVTQIEKRLRKGIGKSIHYEQQEFKIGASIGVAIYPEDGTTPEQLLAIADQRMYENKKARKASR
jgi:diguanylate cyclase (GGDEF)-like protein